MQILMAFKLFVQVTRGALLAGGPQTCLYQ